jgi:hypothetical protein
MKDIFDRSVVDETIERINSLRPDSPALWGKMNVAQMLAHCCVPYEMAFENKHKPPGRIKRFLLRKFAMDGVVSEKPYPRNAFTAPQFRIADQKEFEKERARLIGYIRKTAELGGDHFDGRDYPSFGPLARFQWNNMFYKHLDHHLSQFGA